MQTVLEMFVALARAEDDSAAPTSEPLNLTEELQREVAAVQGRSESGVSVREEYPDAPVILDSQEDFIRIIARNLLENGIKYGGEPPELLVRVEDHGGELHAIFEDNGDGIAAHDRDHVFERGYRRFWRPRLAGLRPRAIHRGAPRPGARRVAECRRRGSTVGGSVHPRAPEDLTDDRSAARATQRRRLISSLGGRPADARGQPAPPGG